MDGKQFLEENFRFYFLVDLNKYYFTPITEIGELCLIGRDYDVKIYGIKMYCRIGGIADFLSSFHNIKISPPVMYEMVAIESRKNRCYSWFPFSINSFKMFRLFRTRFSRIIGSSSSLTL